MKKITAFLFMALLFFGGCEYDDSGLNDRLDGLEDRVEQLEKLCEGFNSDIVSMQAIVNALQNNDYVVSVDPILDNGKTVGYAITFSKSGLVKIYCGKDGAAGEDGQDGQDGYTPLIGVKKASDGVYYWTLDGEWLLDENGDKVRATGEDGQNGSDGQDGEPGKDGVTPQLKIEDGQWYVSYNNGKDWVLLGQATAPDGADGQNGKSYFRSVTVKDGNVYVVLENGTDLILPLLTDDLTDVLSSVVFLPSKLPMVLMKDEIGKQQVSDTLEFRISPAYLAPMIIEKMKTDPDAVYGKLYLTRESYASPSPSPVELVKLPANPIKGDAETGVLSLTLSGESLGEREFLDITINSDVSAKVSLIVSFGTEQIESKIIPFYYRVIGKILFAKFTDSGSFPSLAQLKDTLTTYYRPEDIVEVRMYDEAGLTIIGMADEVDVMKPCFRNMKGLRIAGEQGMSRLDDYALAGNPTLSKFYSSDVSSLGEAAFKGCSQLRRIEFDRTIETMGKQVFMDCTRLRDMHIDFNVRKVPDEAFKNTSGFSSSQTISFSSRLTDIGKSAFEGSTVRFLDETAYVEIVRERAFYGTPELMSMDLRSVIDIREDAFRNSAINHVEAGKNLARIYTGAFFDRIDMGYKLNIIITSIEVPDLVGGPIFNSLDESTDVRIFVPASMVDAYKKHPAWSAMKMCEFVEI